MPSGSASARLGPETPGGRGVGASIGPVDSAGAGRRHRPGRRGRRRRRRRRGPAGGSLLGHLQRGEGHREPRAQLLVGDVPFAAQRAVEEGVEVVFEIRGACHRNRILTRTAVLESTRMRDVRLPEFPCVVGVEVRFRDLDAMGHVNNAVYLTYFEQARLAFWRAIHPGGAPDEAIDPARIGFVLARAECDYASPVRLGERLLVGCRAGDFGTSSFAFDYRIVAAGGAGRRRGPPRGVGPDRPGDLGLGRGKEGPALRWT